MAHKHLSFVAALLLASTACDSDSGPKIKGTPMSPGPVNLDANAYVSLRGLKRDDADLGKGALGAISGQTALWTDAMLTSERDTITFLTVSPSGLEVALASSGNGRVLIYNLAEEKVITELEPGGIPRGVGYDKKEGSWFAVADAEASSLHIYSTADWKKVQTLAFEAESQPNDVAVSPDGDRIFVALQKNERIAVVDATTVGAFVEVSSLAMPYAKPHNLDLTNDGSRLYVTLWPSDEPHRLAAFDVATEDLIGTVQISDGHHGVDVSGDGKWVYVGAHDAGKVEMIDTSTLSVAHSVELGGMVHGLRTSTSGDRVYVTMPGADEVRILSGGEEGEPGLTLETVTFPAGAGPYAVVVP